MDTPYVRTYHEDRELTAWLLLDRSASMGFGPTDRPKGVVLTELATALARLLSRGGNLVGAILTTTRSSARSLRAAVEPRAAPHQGAAAAAEPPARAPTSAIWSRRCATIKRRSLVVIISDFISEPGWERPLSILSQRHEVVAIRLFDPREHELPDAGWIVVEDAETGELLSVDTSDREFRRRFDSRGERDQADHRCRGAHVSTSTGID